MWKKTPADILRANVFGAPAEKWNSYELISGGGEEGWGLKVAKVMDFRLTVRGAIDSNNFAPL